MQRSVEVFGAIVLCAFFAGISTAASFQNLDFEQATIQSAGSDEFGGSLIDSAAALPHWTAQENGGPLPGLQAITVLDFTQISPVTTDPIQGSFSIEMYAAGFNQPMNVSILQTGDVPADAKSIQFSIRSPAVAGGLVPASPTVMLNNTAIPLFMLGNNNGIIEMAGDVSSFAGTNATLTFACAAAPNSNNFFQTENIFDLDSISFSTSPVPEPRAAGLVLFCAILLAARRDHDKKCGRITHL